MTKKARKATKRIAARRGTRAASTRSRLRILIVEARFYEDLSDALMRGARDVLDAANAEYDTVSVPGSLEIPPAVAMALDAGAARRRPYDGVVALGCVIRGDTYHFEMVCNESGRGLMDLAVRERVALGNGILTVDTEAQARARSGSASNKGADAARAALAMAWLKHDLKGK